METLGEVKCYGDLHAIMRARVASLQVTREGLDEIVGLQDGYTAKLLTPTPMRRLGAATMADFLEAIGVKLLAVVDDEAVERHASKIARYRAEKVHQPEPAISAEVERLVRERIHNDRVKVGRRGGKKRTAAMTPEERSELARAGAHARWEQLSPKKRRGAIARLNAARRRKQHRPRKRVSA